MNGNPFAPGFGTSPPVLAGRANVVVTLSAGLELGGNQHSASLIVGPRGAGKTVLLNAIESEMLDRGWKKIAISATSSGGFLEELVNECQFLASSLSAGMGARLTAVTLPFGVGGVEWENKPRPAAPTRIRPLLAFIGEQLDEQESGLLITIDEIHNASLDELQHLGMAIQHVAMREKRPIGFVGAGLPVVLESIQTSKSATFLQRCALFDLEPIPDTEVAAALRSTIVNSGRTITQQALRYATESASGYGYMIQLVGYHTWECGSARISISEAREGVQRAAGSLGQQVLLPMWTGSSRENKRFLVAMTLDAGPSATSDVRRRLKKSAGHMSMYRQRVISDGWVTSAGYGVVKFVHSEARGWIQNRPEYSELMKTLKK